MTRPRLRSGWRKPRDCSRRPSPGSAKRCPGSSSLKIGPCLVQILQEESEYLLGQVGSPNRAEDAARRLQADALLTEAIQISRQLVAEFPNDANYGDRLTALLRTQANHFGQKGDAE